MTLKSYFSALAVWYHGPLDFYNINYPEHAQTLSLYLKGY